MRTKTAGSILNELADDPADAMQLRIKSKLMNAIIDYIDESKLTQAAAAEIMLVQRTRVNDVCNGRIDRMTIDALVAMAARLGLDPLKTAA
ncbi:MAG: helix-turn-helix domain-containing protein [Granulosicoccus sp.]